MFDFDFQLTSLEHMSSYSATLIPLALALPRSKGTANCLNRRLEPVCGGGLSGNGLGPAVAAAVRPRPCRRPSAKGKHACRTRNAVPSAIPQCRHMPSRAGGLKSKPLQAGPTVLQTLQHGNGCRTCEAHTKRTTRTTNLKMTSLFFLRAGVQPCADAAAERCSDRSGTGAAAGVHRAHRRLPGAHPPDTAVRALPNIFC